MKDQYRFVLYLFGESADGAAALANLRRLCEEHLGDDYEVEVVDLHNNISVAETQDIFATPTVERVEPMPAVRIIGDLSDAATVIRHFGLPRDSREQGE